MSKHLDRKVKKSGYKNGEFTNVGFIVKSLGAGQVSYNLVNNCNEWLNNSFGLSLSVFLLEIDQPCALPAFPRYSIGDVVQFDGLLIGTSPESIPYLKKAMIAKKCYYLVGPDFKTHSDVFDEIKNDPEIKIVSRSQDYCDYLNSKYDIIEDFNIEKFLEIACQQYRK